MLPAEPESVPIARHRLERWLLETGEGRDDVLAIKLAVSEACANAVEHAYGPERGRTFRLLSERSAGAVVVQVSDCGTWRAPRGEQRGQVLCVVCPAGSNAQRVLELTAFERETPPEEDRDAAIAAVRRDVPLRG